MLTSTQIPRDELFSPHPTDYALPSWLAEHEESFKSIMAEGFNICNIIYTILGRELQLPPGSLTSMHRADAPSRSFVRILRYPGPSPTQSIKRPRFEAHRDITSIAVLFTWIAGLQIPAENAEYVAPDVETEESWRWVQPLAGHAIVNLGDAMQIFTNGKLKSGKHRVVTAPGDQNRLDRYSVLVTSRPALDTPMRACKSPVIPRSEKEEEVETCGEWGDNCVKSFFYKTVDGWVKPQSLATAQPA